MSHIKIVADSHLDHNIPDDLLREALAAVERERGEDLGAGVVIHTVTVSREVTCQLVGPLVGRNPVPEHLALYVKRGERAYHSRCVVLPPSKTRKVSVIVGPHEDETTVLFTAFGGPPTPKEPEDPAIQSDEERRASRAFWAEHALAYEPSRETA